MPNVDEKFVRDHFGLIWPAHVETLTRFMIECRRHFHGDLDLFLVMCVVGDRTFASSRVPPNLSYDDFNDPNSHTVAPEGLNTRSISDFSGIPRETVRRKVSELINLGWVARDDQGLLRATDQARNDLLPLTEASFSYIITMARTLFAAAQSGSERGGT